MYIVCICLDLDCKLACSAESCRREYGESNLYLIWTVIKFGTAINANMGDNTIAIDLNAVSFDFNHMYVVARRAGCWVTVMSIIQWRELLFSNKYDTIISAVTFEWSYVLSVVRSRRFGCSSFRRHIGVKLWLSLYKRVFISSITVILAHSFTYILQHVVHIDFSFFKHFWSVGNHRNNTSIVIILYIMY